MNVIVIMIQMAFLFMIQKVRWSKEDISQQQRETIEILVVVFFGALCQMEKKKRYFSLQLSFEWKFNMWLFTCHMLYISTLTIHNYLQVITHVFGLSCLVVN